VPLGLNRLGVAAGATGALAAGAFGYLLRRPLPSLDGDMRLKGLTGPVEIVRDRWGIPHISAREPLDAYFGQGFCHAQDRLWQMELTRRLASGRLSEVFGKEALDVDRFQRRVGLHRAAQQFYFFLGGGTVSRLLLCCGHEWDKAKGTATRMRSTSTAFRKVFAISPK